MKNVFVLFLLSSFLLLINTQTIYILESAKEKSSSDKNILSFDIKAGINENIESNINFQIESEFYDGNNFITGEFLEFTKRGAITTFIRKSKGSILQTDDSYKEVHRILWENILSLSEDFWYDIEKIVKEHINFKQTDLEEVNTLTEWFNKTKD